jgi:transcriptional regulator with XRE-family HTH domain
MIGKSMNGLIKRIRMLANMNQEQFAKELGTTVVSINRWENDKAIPNTMAQNQLFEFCKKHNIDLFDHIVDSVKLEKANELILYHGSKKGIVGDIAPKSNSSCDFGQGFYMGTHPDQPLTLICDEAKPKFYNLAVDLNGLNVLNIEIGIDWAMLIAFYRGYMQGIEGTAIYNKYAHFADGYDMVVGYIANDRMYRVMTRFFDGEITDVALLHCLSVLELGKQYVAKTAKACKQITVLSEIELSKLEWKLIDERSIQRRQEAVERTNDILVQYRREGKFFDEILRGE